MKKLRQWWHNTVNMLYQWLATILMWISIASNFSHIEWYIKKRAVKDDWSATAMAFIVEAGLGLSIHQFISSLRASLLSIGKSISKQDRRFNRWLLPIFGLAAFALAWFSAICNTEFFGGDKLLGVVAPALTVAFAILEAAKELLSAKRQTPAKTPEELAEIERQKNTCKVCDTEVGKAKLTKGKCADCQRSAEGKAHSLPLELSLEVLDRDGWQCFYCGRDLREVPAGERHIDHFIPKSKGGKDELGNLVTACQACNLTKNARDPTEREQRRFALWLRAKATGPDKRSQILELTSPNGDGTPLKQKEVAEILFTSPGWVSTVIREAAKEE